MIEHHAIHALRQWQWQARQCHGPKLFKITHKSLQHKTLATQKLMAL